MNRNVLIVDDNKINRMTLHRILRDDYVVLEAEDGQKALDLLYQNYEQISAVLLDIRMPVMDGYEVLKIMRSDNKLVQIPVIITTGDHNIEVEKAALNYGANDFALKPYDADIIKSRLWNLINLHETSAIVNSIKIDALTGLMSRNAFFARVDELVAKQEAGYYVIASFDVDRFKVINDQYGHQKGDEVLKYIADTFAEEFHKVEGICGRIADDKFSALFPGNAMNTEELNRVVQKASNLGGLLRPITFSVGCYIIKDTSLTASAMHDRALLAEASIKGRYDEHLAIYDESMRKQLLREQEIIGEMDSALANHNFEVWFQPQYNHATGAMIGAEALVRWRHPEQGIISPGEFIPVFERNGFIYELDKYVWEQTCKYLRKWLDEGRSPQGVSVNISRYDLFRDDLVDVIAGFVNQYDIPVELLRLEITESAFAQSTEQIIRVVDRFIMLGFIVEIDDFGSGYSSLNTLKDVPAQVVKLDMRFLEGDSNSIRGGSIIESIVRMTKWLGMSVIAEGVETQEQADYLKSIGCNYIQGYLYAKPMPAEGYEASVINVSREEKRIELELVDTLDNDAFWNPKSLETLIFNSYVGGACVIEYYNGKLELLRANDKYMKMFCKSGVEAEDVLSISWFDYLDKESRENLLTHIEAAIVTKEEVVGEYVYVGPPGSRERIHIRTNMRNIASAENRHLMYCMNEDVTAQRAAEENEKKAYEQMRFLNDISHDLLSQADSDSAIETVLTKLLHYFDGARVYIFELDAVKEVLNNTYEVCADGVTSEKDELQKIPMQIMTAWYQMFEQKNYVSIENVSALDDSRAAERKVLTEQGIHSLVAVALRKNGVLIGFIGIDDPTRRHMLVERFDALGDYIAVMLARRDFDRKIRNDNLNAINLMNDTPGGFARLRVTPEGNVSKVFVNHGYCRMFGITYAEAMDNSVDAMWRVHPDDISFVRESISRVIKTNEVINIKYRLLGSNKEYIWIMVYGRISEKTSEGIYINAYYTHLIDSERKNAAAFG